MLASQSRLFPEHPNVQENDLCSLVLFKWPTDFKIRIHSTALLLESQATLSAHEFISLPNGGSFNKVDDFATLNGCSVLEYRPDDLQAQETHGQPKSEISVDLSLFVDGVLRDGRFLRALGMSSL